MIFSMSAAEKSAAENVATVSLSYIFFFQRAIRIKEVEIFLEGRAPKLSDDVILCIYPRLGVIQSFTPYRYQLNSPNIDRAHRKKKKIMAPRRSQTGPIYQEVTYIIVSRRTIPRTNSTPLYY